MRVLAVLAAVVLAVPAVAQDKPAWVGVWEGRIGSYPVRACFDTWGDDGPGRGSYYYLSRLEPISLSDEESEGGWTERASGSDDTALWEFAEQTATRLRGTWQGSRSLPFDLAPVSWTESEWGGPCASDEFLAPRIAPGAVDEETVEEGGWRYTIRRYRPPRHFAEDVTIMTFAFADEQPGDPAINRELAAYLPQGSVRDEFVQCFAGTIASHGVDGYFEQAAIPKLVNSAFLAIHEASSDYCGGAHPNHGFRSRTFDRASGAEVDLFGWIGVPRTTEGWSQDLPPDLLAAVLARWPADPAEDEAECREVAESTTFWDLELRETGIAFWPDVPHVALPCRIESLLDWTALAPRLTDEGRAGLARLR